MTPALFRFAAMLLAGALLVSCTRGTVDTIPVAPTPVVRKLTVTPVGGVLITAGASAPIVSSGGLSSNPGVIGAFAEYSDGSGRYVEAAWTSSDANIVSVDPTAVRAIARGTATVTATFQGHSDQEQFEVVGGIAGTWAGSYVVERCGGTTSSASELMCAPPGPGRQPGVAYVGATLPIMMELAVSGDDVTGTVSFGNFRGTLTGKDRGAGRFFLQGVIEGAVVLTISHWDALVRTDEMQGFVNYQVRFPNVAGFGEVGTRLVNVTRR